MENKTRPGHASIDTQTYQELMRKMVHEIKIRNEMGYKTRSIWAKEDDGYHGLVFTHEPDWSDITNPALFLNYQIKFGN